MGPGSGSANELAPSPIMAPGVEKSIWTSVPVFRNDVNDPGVASIYPRPTN
jgi:hypothetical protein